MGLVFYYRCHHCGFEIYTELGWKNLVFFGEYWEATVKCQACDSIEYIPFFEDTKKSLRQAIESSVCKNCGTKGKFEIWCPKKGCPKCGHKLKGGIPIGMVD